METSPLFSVLCVCWNEEAYLGECLRSVLTQTEGSLELILIDDHSTDGTWALMTAAAAADPRVVAIRNPTKSKVAGFNHAVEQARGRWIHLLGGDDLLDRTCLEQCRKVIEAAGPELSAVYHDYTILNKETGAVMASAEHGPWLAEATVEEAWRKKYGIGGGFFAIRTDLARGVIWPQPVTWTNEDTALAAVLKVLGEVRHLPAPLYFYRLAEKHYYLVPTLESHRQDQIHYSAGLELLRERSPSAWDSLTPAARLEAERHFRHSELLKTSGWSILDAWKSDLGLRRFAMVAVYRCGPRAYNTFVGLHRKLRNLSLGFRMPGRR
jgi:glycosyltransferase involved in cell wall biosynthesis